MQEPLNFVKQKEWPGHLVQADDPHFHLQLSNFQVLEFPSLSVVSHEPVPLVNHESHQELAA